MNRMIHQMELEPEDNELCKKAFVMAIRDALNVVSGKWKLAIICTLLSGPKGFADIERLLATISPRMLARELRELEVNGAITRPDPAQHGQARQGVAQAGRGGRYQLTPSGRALEKVVFMLADWGKEHRALSASTQATDHGA
ncbi:helix-turn-helix transcriptional regulator [Pseudomonas sp. GX19020]|uniref:winged helix-turn-helix transcriptional regulator n=1 Tax=Pseudomonas sp. GX19020 TaxID=2942277 RepID=UPI002018C9C2|nr:helix-turn-helix domain-containing protein [Pseudomonas sp. GX19020]MCL4066443.1 helix-turn-helix transcriptional regulator [Pseudomonas sp. GX19020]